MALLANEPFSKVSEIEYNQTRANAINRGVIYNVLEVTLSIKPTATRWNANTLKRGKKRDSSVPNVAKKGNLTTGHGDILLDPISSPTPPMNYGVSFALHLVAVSCVHRLLVALLADSCRRGPLFAVSCSATMQGARAPSCTRFQPLLSTSGRINRGFIYRVE